MAQDPAGKTPTDDPGRDAFVALRGLGKEYPGVRALVDVSFDIAPGSVHALVGENGAGKSTLIKLIAGALRPSAGEIHVAGQTHGHLTPRSARALGVRLVAQERQACADLTVTENVLLGRLPKLGGSFGPVSYGRAHREASRRLEEVGLEIDPRRRMRELSVAQIQLVEIARALSANARLVIMDEPTAAMSGGDLMVLFDVIRRMRDRGVSFLYVSHHLEEVFELADTVSVLRDGRHVVTRPLEGLTVDQLVELLLGRKPETLERQRRERATTGSQAPVLEVLDAHKKPALHGVTLTVAAGEILAVTGGIGSGRRELARCLAGIDPPDDGEVRLVSGERLQTPRQAIRNGIAFLPEDRKHEGVLADLDVADNVGIGRRAAARSLFDMPARRRRDAAEMVRRLRIKTPSLRQTVRLLSGGNQQKTLLGRWLGVGIKVLVLDAPTEGIDIGSRLQIYELLRDLAEDGMAVVIFSSDFEEVRLVAERAVVLRRGKVVGDLGADEITEERLYALQYGTPAAGARAA
jgi:ABC-type sugar transport system ATPase subunit